MSRMVLEQFDCAPSILPLKNYSWIFRKVLYIASPPFTDGSPMTGVYIHHLKHLCGGDDAMNFLRTIRVSWWQVCLSNNHPTSQNSCCGNPKLSVLRTNHSGCSGQAFTTAQAVCRITWSPLWFQELEWSTRTIGLGRMAIARLAVASMPSAELVRVNWSSSALSGDGSNRQLYYPVHRVSSASLPRPAQPRAMGNKNDGKGLFAPIVVIARNAIGKKEFNQLRGKAIALHSQVCLCLPSSSSCTVS